MDRGAQPYQDFDLLVAVRNTLVHYRPEVHPEGGDPGTLQSLRRRLAAKRLVPPHSSEEIRSIFGDVANHNVAEWALEAALGMIVSVARLLPSAVGERALCGYRAAGVLQGENAT